MTTLSTFVEKKKKTLNSGFERATQNGVEELNIALKKMAPPYNGIEDRPTELKDILHFSAHNELDEKSNSVVIIRQHEPEEDAQEIGRIPATGFPEEGKEKALDICFGALPQTLRANLLQM